VRFEYELSDVENEALENVPSLFTQTIDLNNTTNVDQFKREISHLMEKVHGTTSREERIVVLKNIFCNDDRSFRVVSEYTLKILNMLLRCSYGHRVAISYSLLCTHIGPLLWNSLAQQPAAAAATASSTHTAHQQHQAQQAHTAQQAHQATMPSKLLPTDIAIVFYCTLTLLAGSHVCEMNRLYLMYSLS
jgi:hypothetical protein